MLTPYMAVANEENTAIAVKMPRTELTAAGWENDAPFLMTAWKQAISVCVLFENTRKVADPSKSGITSAIAGIPDTSDADTGIMASPLIGLLLFMGHRLYWLVKSGYKKPVLT